MTFSCNLSSCLSTHHVPVFQKCSKILNIIFCRWCKQAGCKNTFWTSPLKSGSYLLPCNSINSTSMRNDKFPKHKRVPVLVTAVIKKKLKNKNYNTQKRRTRCSCFAARVVCCAAVQAESAQLKLFWGSQALEEINTQQGEGTDSFQNTGIPGFLSSSTE